MVHEDSARGGVACKPCTLSDAVLLRGVRERYCPFYQNTMQCLARHSPTTPTHIPIRFTFPKVEPTLWRVRFVSGTRVGARFLEHRRRVEGASRNTSVGWFPPHTPTSPACGYRLLGG